MTFHLFPSSSLRRSRYGFGSLLSPIKERRVRVRGLHDFLGSRALCRPGALTGRFLRQVARAQITNRRGFTLIEMIGVLAVMAVLAAVLLPALLKETDVAVSNQETATLQSFATGLQNYIMRNRSIPSETNWFSVVATEYGLDTNDVAINPRHLARAFLIDPSGWFTNVPSGAAYNQTSGGTTVAPGNARLIILSVLGNVAIPSLLASGRPYAADFNATWNAAPNTIPASSIPWSSWSSSGGRAADIIIQRINLGPLFNHLVLNNTDPTNAPYSIDGNTNYLTQVNPQLNAWFLTSTVFNLYLANTNLEASQILLQDSSWWFTAGVWRNSSVPAGSSPGSLQPIVQNFYTNKSLVSISTTNIYNDMMNYMSNYVQNGNLGSLAPLTNDINSIIQ